MIRASTVFSALLMLAVGCGGDPSPTSTEIRIEDGEGTPVQPFYAWWGKSSGEVRSRTCPDDGSDGAWSCTASGLHLSEHVTKAELTIKSASTRFASVFVDELDEPTIVLLALPAFEQTSTHATGSPRGELDLVEALAATDTTSLGPVSMIKFYIADLDTEPKLYLQNTRRFPTHFAFAQQVLGAASTPGGFAAATYHGEDRKAMAGTISYYPNLTVLPREGGAEVNAPFLLEFFPSDDLSPDLMLIAHRLIEEQFGAVALDGHRHRLLYVPAGNQQEEAATKEAHRLQRRGVLWATAADLYAGIEEQSLNPGVGYGTLRRLTPTELAQTAVSYRDILLLTRLPNDLPIVAGTITEELQTPLAHVNLLAKARGTPNLALVSASEDDRVAPWLDQLIRFEVTTDGFSITAATEADAEAFYASRPHERFTPERDLELTGLPGFDDLGFADYLRVGSKAANLAELHRLLPEATPNGFAIPFRAYQRHLERNRVDDAGCTMARMSCIASGRDASRCDMADAHCRTSSADGLSMAQHIAELTTDPAVSIDTLLRDAELSVIRSLIVNAEVDPEWALELDARVAELFGSAQIRLRSSTNVEDLANFNGAGLYESYSAYATGPKRASSVVRQVWASVFAFAAFEERAYWNVDPQAVAMGVAVNPAFDGERANGVIITGGIAPCGPGETYVNAQQGEVSVTNPVDGALAEAFCIVQGPDGAVQPRVLRYSSLSPKGSLLSLEEVREIDRTTRLATSHFAPLYGQSPSTFSLDLEFKIMGTERRLVLKQARPFSSGSN